jgi:hypothetical protein
MTYQHVLNLAMALPDADRARLVDELSRSVARNEPCLGLTPAQSQQLRRRLMDEAGGRAELEAGDPRSDGSQPRNW